MRAFLIENINIPEYKQNPLWIFSDSLRKKYPYSGVIYMYKNLANGKIYIGQTIRPYERHKQHITGSASDNTDISFENALRKYGADSFEYWILRICKSQNVKTLSNKLDKYERLYIEQYQSQNRNIGYNIRSGGTQLIQRASRCVKIDQYSLDNAFLATFHSYADASRAVCGVSNVIKNALKKGSVAYGYRWALHGQELLVNQHSNEVSQYDLSGNLIATYESALQASIKLGLSTPSGISLAICDDYRMCCQSYWRKGHAQHIQPTYRNAVYRYDLLGNFMEMYVSKSEAYFHIFGKKSSSLLSRAIKNKCQCANSYWSDKYMEVFDIPEPADTIFQYDKDTYQFIRGFATAKDACLELGISPALISNCLNGINKTAGGFLWAREKHSVLPHTIINTIFRYDARTGVFVSGYPNLSIAAHSCGLKSAAGILEYLNGRINCAGNSLWSRVYVERMEPVESRCLEIICKYDRNGNLIAEYPSRRQAAKMECGHEYSYKPISKAIKDHTQMAFGGYWRNFKTDKIII